MRFAFKAAAVVAVGIGAGIVTAHSPRIVVLALVAAFAVWAVSTADRREVTR